MVDQLVEAHVQTAKICQVDSNGKKISHQEMGKPIDYFEQFFSPEIFDLFVQMTNLNAKRKVEEGAKGQWKNVSLSEMKAFFGLCVTMGILRLSRVEEYWRKVDWLFLTPSFGEVMSGDRFVLIF